jgi:hypothetical protein
MLEKIVKTMGYIELYSPDPVNYFLFSSSLKTRVTITYHKKIEGLNESHWRIETTDRNPVPFNRGDIMAVLKVSGVSVDEFYGQLRTVALTYASVALIGVDDLADVFGMDAIVSAKGQWLSFMDDLTALANKEVKRRGLTSDTPREVSSSDEPLGSSHKKFSPLVVDKASPSAKIIRFKR